MGLLDLVFPRTCVGCGEFGAYVCASCVNMVGECSETICPMCAKLAILGRTHARCEKVLGMDGLVAGLKYKGVVRRIMGKLKYKLVKDVYDELVELFISMGDLSVLGGREWLVVGVPLHPRRERWRGFNQADELAIRLSDYFGWQVSEGVLVRKKYTEPQIKLDKERRMQNMIGAFGKGGGIDGVVGKRVLLVDDVWTTGATMRECGKVLKRAGVREVWGLVVAR